MNKTQFNENLETNDLKRLVHPDLHIDEYKSKMGDDADVCVLSLMVTGKEPAGDLVSFIEKGYPFVLDADVSSGEKDNGKYLVFIELDRNPEIPANIIKMLEEILNLTDQDITEWTFKYRKSNTTHELTEDNLKAVVPLTSDDYHRKFDKEQKDLDQLKTAAGVDVNTKAPVNDFTESLRVAAGIR